MGQAGVGGAKTIRGSLIMPKSMMAIKSAASNSRTSSPSSSRKKNAFPVFGKVEVPPGLYNDVDWSFSTTKLASSILAPVHDASDFAINLNLCEFVWFMVSSFLMYDVVILEYIGNTKAATLDRSSKLSTAFGTSIQRIQRLFEQCIELPILANELYLQLIKMTRTHEDKTSYACIQMWRLMCVSVGVVVPTIPEIMDYLKAHLRRCEAIDPKDKLGEKERSKSGNLMEKFGLAEASGFAIYQYYAKSELALFAEDKISDVIFKCEKASHASQTADKVHFIIKKRLFDEPLKPTDHPVEDEFVRWQVVEDIKNDRYPLKPDDLIVAAGLTAQIQFGDAVLGAVESYQEFSTKVIPKRLLSIEMSEKVAEQHAKFVGKSGRECHDQFMALAKIQPLFGYTVFSVLVSEFVALKLGTYKFTAIVHKSTTTGVLACYRI
ncbi:cytochrome c oxidase subunit 1 [Rhizoclosmatium hyalinum]|nr:cytochrome c oxidase subunit 1 [Rhizoclosmatium hyalinum]